MANNKRRKKTSDSKIKKKATRNVTARTTSSKPRAMTGKKVRPAAKKKRSSRSNAKEVRSPEPSTLGGRIFSTRERRSRTGIGSRSAGQSGDVQALPRKAVADSESVEELLEEGQAREAAAISGVEDAPDPDEAEVRTRQSLEDDVPEEYTDDN
jgi:hypothetical protein